MEAVKKVEVVCFRTYNILNSRNVNFESELHGMAQANVDLVLLQEIKINDGVYVLESAGFYIVALYAPSFHHGGVALFCK